MRPGTESRCLERRRRVRSGRCIVGYFAHGEISPPRVKAAAATMRSAIGQPILRAGRAVAFLRCESLFSKDESGEPQSVRLAAGNHRRIVECTSQHYAP
jgi:hypothetical protein